MSRGTSWMPSEPWMRMASSWSSSKPASSKASFMRPLKSAEPCAIVLGVGDFFYF
jgi:hypothetical protein